MVNPPPASIGLVCDASSIDHGPPRVIRVGVPYVSPEAAAAHALKSARGPEAHARQDQALALRREGLTLEQIGALLEVSRARAGQMVKRAEAREQAARNDTRSAPDRD